MDSSVGGLPQDTYFAARYKGSPHNQARMENSPNITWQVKPFDELSVHELYAILQLRSAIFVVEQQCIFLDMDDNDQKAQHCMGWVDSELVACTRLFAPQVMYAQASIGRVVVASRVRRFGIGKALMRTSIQYCQTLFGPSPIKIGAQLYLQQFYEGFGFRPISEVYLEDDILHIYMELS